MAAATLKSLHLYLRLIENAPELRRRMPASSSSRSLKDGLSEIGKLVGTENGTSKDPRNIAAAIGAQRFIMIWGEPRVDARLAAADLLEALALTPWSLSVNNAIAAASTNSIRSIKTIARHFERFTGGEETKEQANKEIGDHLLAFARQFSADRTTA